MPESPPVISVFGSYAPKPGEPLYEQAYRVGLELGRAGYTVCNGGYDGTMEASARGAKEAGASTIGVTCSIFNDYRGIPLQANSHIDREITSEGLFDRIQKMMDLSSGYVVLEGGTGTLTEFALVWEYVCKKLMPTAPIFVMGDFWRPVVGCIKPVRPKHCRHVHEVDNVEEIVEILGRYIPATDAHA